MNIKFLSLLAFSLVFLVLAYEFNGPNWQSLPAVTKKNMIWDECLKDPKAAAWPSTAALLNLFVFSVQTSFDTVADDMPYQGVFNLFRRQKLIHSVGAITQIKWVSNGNHNYTGLFQGSSNAFLRFSNAKKVDLKADKPYAPGLSFKFLRTGKKSANFFAMISLEGVPTPNFLLHDFTNHVPDLSDSAPAQLRLLGKTFRKASAWPNMVGVSDFARYDENGHESIPNYPFRLIFHPPAATRAILADVQNAEDLPTLLTQKLKQGHLFEIYVESVPNAKPSKIGDIFVTSPATASTFADQYLFFQHQRMEEDFRAHPEWEAPAQAIGDKQRSTPYFVYPDLPDN